MGCCESRGAPRAEFSDSLAGEVRKSKAQLAAFEKDLLAVKERMALVAAQLQDFEVAVQERTELAKIGGILAKLEEATQAQFVSERHSTHLQQDELLENIRFHQILKAQVQLQSWRDLAQQHLSSPLSATSLQVAQAQLQQLTIEVRRAFETIKRCHQSLQRKFATQKDADMRSWQAFESRLEVMCEGLIHAAEGIDRSLSALLVKLQELISPSDLRARYTEVQESLGLLQGEVKPLGRMSYKEITEEILCSSPLTRTSTADSISHFDQLFLRVNRASAQAMDHSELESMAASLLEVIVVRGQRYAERLESFRPLEMDVLEHFLSVYKSQAADKLRQFAKALQALETEDYALFVARALCFSPKEYFHFLPKLLRGLKPISHDFDWRHGGFIRPQALLSAIENWFLREPQVGSLVISELSKHTADPPRFTVYCVQAKMAATRTTAAELFADMDEENAQHLRVDTFAERLKQRFEGLLPLDEDLTALGESLDKTNSGAIFRSEFVPVLGEKVEVAEIQCVAVVKAFETAYCEMQADQAYELYQLFTEESGPDYRLTITQVVALIQRMRSALSSDLIQHLIGKVKLKQSGFLTFEEFRELVWRFNLKSPAESYFGQPLYDPEHFEVSEEVMDLVASLSSERSATTFYITRVVTRNETNSIILLTSEEGQHLSANQDIKRLMSFLSAVNEQIDYGSVLYDSETEEVMYKTGQSFVDERSARDVVFFMLRQHWRYFPEITKCVQVLTQDLRQNLRDLANRAVGKD